MTSSRLTLAEKLSYMIEASLDAGKALDIEIIPLAGKSDIADFMVVATGTSDRHLASLADKVQQVVNGSGYTTAQMEGAPTSGWVLLDNPLVVVHLFTPEVREDYGIDKMWRVEFEEPEMAGLQVS